MVDFPIQLCPGYKMRNLKSKTSEMCPAVAIIIKTKISAWIVL